MKKDFFKNKKTSTPTKKNYSSIQYFFWLLSGCEINILKDCPTDYNRQAGIGFTIFMTTVLAFCSGGYAGWYFGESYTTAIVFGLLWSALIFSIDRSMVVTLKKDPTKKKQSFWAPLLSRGIMALLIAFIISIPLELLIFQENIEANMALYKKNQTNELQNASSRNENIEDKEKDKKENTLLLEQVKKELAQGEPNGDPEYDNLKSDFNSRNEKYGNLIEKHNLVKTSKNNAKKKVPTYYDSSLNKVREDISSMEWKNFKQKEKLENIARINLNNFDKEGLNKAETDLKKYKSKWISNKKNDQNTFNDNVKNQTIAISNSKKKITDETIAQDSKTKNQKGFVLRFMILEDLATCTKRINIKSANGEKKPKLIDNPNGQTMSFLLWLIRILFFTIEILPTIAKIATPLGAYDFAIYRKEREIEEDLEKRTEDYIKQQQKIRELENNAHQEQVIAKNSIENELHGNLLKEIASAQNDVAKKQIEDFRKKHL